jgi:hypothetical protein
MAEKRFPRQVRVQLTEEMSKALYELSVRERRVPPDQAAILLRDRLVELGYLNGGEISKHILEPSA